MVITVLFYAFGENRPFANIQQFAGMFVFFFGSLDTFVVAQFMHNLVFHQASLERKRQSQSVLLIHSDGKIEVDPSHLMDLFNHAVVVNSENLNEISILVNHSLQVSNANTLMNGPLLSAKRWSRPNEQQVPFLEFLVIIPLVGCSVALFVMVMMGDLLPKETAIAFVPLSVVLLIFAATLIDLRVYHNLLRSSSYRYPLRFLHSIVFAILFSLVLGDLRVACVPFVLLGQILVFAGDAVTLDGQG